jgi:hypothetical protein
MKIAFFTEMNFKGKIPRNYDNMRVEFAWMVALNAHHYNIQDIPTEHYDLGLILTPKTTPELVDMPRLKQYCDKIGILQEGPFWYYQDYDLPKQIQYFNNLTLSDIIFTHNETDKKYYQGLTAHPDVRVIPSLMIEDAIGELKQVKRQGVIIGGNFVSWYGGFDSFIIAQELDRGKVTSPSMGRKQQGEDQLLTQLPYVNWKQWIHELNSFKYAIHLMRTHAAGTFALNCAYLGIPCIGYKGLDTQELCHPKLTVDLGDLVSARKCALALKNDETFYNECSQIAKENYKKYFSEEQFLNLFK